MNFNSLIFKHPPGKMQNSVVLCQCCVSGLNTGSLSWLPSLCPCAFIV